ncbi:hypothetical protein Cni_G02673 [Canna indica]|uniref:RING-type domain-containing protein n=1 Tax=Canna indica TaxID=4628 RepID=A0AAQ3JQF1_9LILI|nr:hypothetical protein Cni_G02673 [Canna indica]
MGSDAKDDNSASLPAVVAGKKRRANRSAKLKQCKLDARREQWLSQVKDKDDGKLTSTVSPTHLVHPPRAWTGKNDPETMVEEDERADSFDSPPSIENRRRNTCRNNSVSSRSSSLQSTSRSVSDAEEDVEEKGVLDDWEEIADALSEDHRGGDDRNRHRRRYCDRALASVEPASSPAIRSDATRARRTIKQERVLSSRRAWRLENSPHPPLLNVPTKWSFPLSNADQHYQISRQKGILPLPISCPICCEDLDLTDSSFLPCSCGFRLCLFCHKRILETDGRCPGCRKQYDCMLDGQEGMNTGRP